MAQRTLCHKILFDLILSVFTRCFSGFVARGFCRHQVYLPRTTINANDQSCMTGDGGRFARQLIPREWKTFLAWCLKIVGKSPLPKSWTWRRRCSETTTWYFHTNFCICFCYVCPSSMHWFSSKLQEMMYYSLLYVSQSLCGNNINLFSSVHEFRLCSYSL